jgi:Acyl-CoA dehydrogenase, C-terminal domain
MGWAIPDGIVVDAEAGHIYWTNMGNPIKNDGFIERADLDGKNRTTIVPKGGTFTPKQLHLEKKSGKLYWCDREGMRVMRCNLDGSKIETLVDSSKGDPRPGKDATKWCVGITVDPDRGKIYWTQKGPTKGGTGRIFRANIELPKGETAANRSDIEVVFDNSPWCDISIIWARDLADNQVKSFIIENKTTPGFKVEKIQNKIALKVVQNGVITMENCRVPEENRLQGDSSFRDTARVLKMTRFLVAWEATGCAMGAYENALKYSQERLQFGKPIGSFQLVQDLLAKMLANITASQCLIVRMAQLQAEGKLSDAHAAIAKAFTTAKCRETVAWARELLGGNGIAAEYNVGRFFADSEALYSYEGTYQMQNLIIGKAITGFSAFV